MRLPAAAIGVALVSLASVIACSPRGADAEPPPCLADELEPNDTATSRASLGAIQDDATIGEGEDAPDRVRRDFTAHAAGDVDWFDVEVRDTGAGGNPTISLIVSEGFDATAWWECTNGTTESVLCGVGSAVEDDPELAGRGCLTQPAGIGPPQLNMQIECGGTSTDNGSLRVRVRRLEPTDACVYYRLTVAAE